MKKILISVLVLFLFSCSLTQNKSKKFRNKFLFSAKPIQSDFAENISFKLKNDLILISVKIDDESYTFLLDTGAPTVISPEIAKKYLY